MKNAKTSLVLSIVAQIIIVYSSWAKLNGISNFLGLGLILLAISGIFLFISLFKENKGSNPFLWGIAFFLFPGIVNIIYYFMLRNKFSFNKIPGN
ncbi:MAG TPA: hypothetical protein PKX92_11560 [Edaphocola sp.]|nr:hypothetical protein [Edaphocola sp.]